MSAGFDEAVGALYRAPLDAFVSERKRLAAEMKAAGDKAGAARFAKLGRPTIAAWAVNQLYWQARGEFDELLTAGERLRGGDLGATALHREALAKLRARAATLVTEAGHPVTEAALRRVQTDLAAVAAAGGFDPDPPGALSGDRDPPGFDLAGMVVPDDAPSAADRLAAQKARDEEERQRLAAQRDKLERERQKSEQERRRAEQERAQREAERRQLEAEVRTAKGELDSRQRQVDWLKGEIDRLQRELAEAQAKREKAEAALAAVEARLRAT